MRREIIVLFIVVAAFVTVATIVVLSHGLPEEGAITFNPLSQDSTNNQIRIIKNASATDNTFVYAISDAAARAIEIAMNDSSVKEILHQSKGSAIVIA